MRINISENIIIQLVAALLGFSAIYGALKNKVSRLEKDFTLNKKEDTASKKELSSKLDAQFRRVDKCFEKIIILERDTSTHLDMVKAEEKFVSKRELELHLRNIELMTANTNQKVQKIEGNVEDLLRVLTDGTIKVSKNE